MQNRSYTKNGGTSIGLNIMRKVGAAWQFWVSDSRSSGIITFDRYAGGGEKPQNSIGKGTLVGHSFAKFSTLYLLETKNRQKYLSEKRWARKKTCNLRANPSNGPESPTPVGTSQSSKVKPDTQRDVLPQSIETQRSSQDADYSRNQRSTLVPSQSVLSNPVTPQNCVASNASIAAAGKNSGEGPIIYSAREKECDTFVNLLLRSLDLLWLDEGLRLEWVTRRRFHPKFIWRDAYLCRSISLLRR